MVPIEDEHHLRYEVKVYRCIQGHAVPTHSTGEHGVCVCGWELWSRNGRAEILEAHGHHVAFERRKREAEQTMNHGLQLNVTGDAATCSYCNWFYSSTSIAKIMNEFHQHQKDVRNAV